MLLMLWAKWQKFGYFWMGGRGNSKFEARNSKQARMFKIRMIQTKIILNFEFWILACRQAGVSDFDIRISDLPGKAGVRVYR
jgi:hypothetical protein